LDSGRNDKEKRKRACFYFLFSEEMKMKVKAMVLRAAGTNCDVETAYAFELAGAQAARVHINELVRREKSLSEVQILAIPGGFTYGDDVAAGKILANELKYKLSDEIGRFVEEGKLILGICNGFQVLVKAGLLPEWKDGPSGQQVTLTFNDSGRYEDRWVVLAKEQNSRCVFVEGIEETIYLPVAHAEGKFVPADGKVLAELERRGQVVFRYVDERGERASYPWNPNGSVGNIAGICDPTGRIFGLMPHPERHILPTQHPRWTREGLQERGAGRIIFENAVRVVREQVGM